MQQSSPDDTLAGASEYTDAMLVLLQWIWGDDYMAPGGEGNVARLVDGLDIRGKRVLDVGSGLGGPAFALARRFGAEVTGTDLESHLVARATRRARELELADRVRFLRVEPGPMPFPDAHFHAVFTSGAITQTADKLGVFREIHRILEPGGVFRTYDWMKAPGEYSAEMHYWFKLEGITYAMETLERHGEILREAGFRDIELLDASAWFRREVRAEHERLRSNYETIVAMVGTAEADHIVENWRATVVVCDNGEMRQGYLRARK